MKNCINTYIKHPNKCLVITSSISLSRYPRLSLIPSSTLIYSCFDENSVMGVPNAHSYDIILDFDNPEIGEIIFSLFNKLLSFTSDISVIAAHCASNWKPVTSYESASVRKLRDHSLIKLEILDDTEAKHADFSIDLLENVECFIGPGNTGKTSILSSISEIFAENRQSIALLDLTQEHKLVHYLSDSMNISAVLNSFTEHGQWDIPYNYIHCSELVSLYNFGTAQDKPCATPILLYKFIEYLSKVYSRVIINADYAALNRFESIFNCINKIFIVYDLAPTKIDLSYKLLLKLNTLGLTAKQNVSIIYNKVEKRTADIQFFEENVIFDKCAGDKLTPIIDVQCNTFELPYSRRTMAALLHKFKSKDPTLKTASKSYMRNIYNIYKSINDIQYTESYDMQFNELVCCYTEKLKNIIPFNLLKRTVRIFFKGKNEILNDYTHSAQTIK